MQIGIAGTLVQMKVSITKIVIGKMNGKHASILNKTLLLRGVILYAISGHWPLWQNDIRVSSCPTNILKC